MSQVRLLFELSFIFRLKALLQTSLSLVLQTGQEDEQTQRLEVKDEDLAEAKDKLGTSGAVKGKTFQVMQECGEDMHTQTQTHH